MKYQELFREMGIVNKERLQKALGCSENTAQTILHRALTDTPRNPASLMQVRRNFYVAIADGKPLLDRFTIGCNINENSIISHHTAFEYYKITDKYMDIVYVKASPRFRSFEFDGLTYQYLPHKFGYGVISTEEGVRVTSIERTIIECMLDFKKANGLAELLRCLENIGGVDEFRLRNFLQIYKSPFLYQRAGFILSFFRERMRISQSFFDDCQAQLGPIKRRKDYTYLVRGQAPCYTYPEWHLYAPKKLFPAPPSDFLDDDIF